MRLFDEQFCSKFMTENAQCTEFDNTFELEVKGSWVLAYYSIRFNMLPLCCEEKFPKNQK